MSIHSPIEFETKLSTDGKIRVETTSYIRAKDTPSSQVILTALRDLEITQTPVTIIMSLPKEGNFNREVPLAFLYRSVTVYLPSDVQLTFGNSGIETYRSIRNWGR